MKWEIEANIGCRKKVEKYLWLVKGVESVDLYPDISKVVVMGDVNPGVLLREVQRVKKKARILAKGASSPAKNLSAMGDEHGRGTEDNNNKNNNLAVAVVPVKEVQVSEKTIKVYKPSRRSNGRGEVASESKSYGATLEAYGFGVGFLYRWAKTYRKQEQRREGTLL